MPRRATRLEGGGYHGSKPQPPTMRGVCAKEHRPTAWGGARHGFAAHTTAPSPQRAVRALWAVGWFSIGLSARVPRATGLEGGGYDGSKPQPPTMRGVCAKEPRPTAWGGARRGLAAHTTAPSPQRAVRALWAVGWFSIGLSARARRATGLERGAYDGSKPQPPTARCMCKGASANGVGWSASRVGRADNRAKSAARRVRALWAVGWFSTDLARARGAPRD